MKHRFTKLFLAAALSPLLGNLPLNAQNLAAKANIPFAFHAQERLLPAGEYLFKEQVQTGVFQLVDKSGHSVFVNASIPGAATDHTAKITFACYEHECVLAKISIPGALHTFEVSSSAIEKNLPRKLGIASMISVPLRTH